MLSDVYRKVHYAAEGITLSGVDLSARTVNR